MAFDCQIRITARISNRSNLANRTLPVVTRNGNRNLLVLQPRPIIQSVRTHLSEPSRKMQLTKHVAKCLVAGLHLLGATNLLGLQTTLAGAFCVTGETQAETQPDAITAAGAAAGPPVSGAPAATAAPPSLFGPQEFSFYGLEELHGSQGPPAAPGAAPSSGAITFWSLRDQLGGPRKIIDPHNRTTKMGGRNLN